MRILLLNWRDIKNPQSGGAEIATFEIAKRLVKHGHKVVQISSSFKNSKKREIHDGIEIIRMGGTFTIHILAFLHYQKYLKGKFDLVIDQIHGIPFFTPIYIKEPKIAYIHEVAGSVWFHEWPFIIGLIGLLLEKLYFKIYKNIIFITASNSTRKQLIKNGQNSKNIKQVHYGLTIEKSYFKYSFRKEQKPTIIIVSRLTQSKRIEDIIKGFLLVKKEVNQPRLWIVGRGKKSYITQLKKIIKKSKLKNDINFFGFVSQKKKFELLSKAWVISSASVKEGFGLSIIEAGYCKTPAVVYNVDGLKEAVINNKTGLVCKRNTPEELAKNIKILLINSKLRNELAKNAQVFSKQFNWDKSAKKFEEVMLKIISKKSSE